MIIIYSNLFLKAIPEMLMVGRVAGSSRGDVTSLDMTMHIYDSRWQR